MKLGLTIFIRDVKFLVLFKKNNQEGFMSEEMTINSISDAKRCEVCHCLVELQRDIVCNDCLPVYSANIQKKSLTEYKSEYMDKRKSESHEITKKELYRKCLESLESDDWPQKLIVDIHSKDIDSFIELCKKRQSEFDIEINHYDATSSKHKLISLAGDIIEWRFLAVIAYIILAIFLIKFYYSFDIELRMSSPDPKVHPSHPIWKVTFFALFLGGLIHHLEKCLLLETLLPWLYKEPSKHNIAIKKKNAINEYI